MRDTESGATMARPRRYIVLSVSCGSLPSARRNAGALLPERSLASPSRAKQRRSRHSFALCRGDAEAAVERRLAVPRAFERPRDGAAN